MGVLSATTTTGTATITSKLTIGSNSDDQGVFTVGTPSSEGVFTIASVTGTNTLSSTFSILGGVADIYADIKDTSNAGTVSTTLTLDGGKLDLKTHAIGGTGLALDRKIDNLNFRSGALANVAQINNGDSFIKTSSGTLTLSGTNAFTGSTTVSEGTLVVSGGLTGTAGLNVNAGTLRLGASDVLKDAAPVTLGGGTFQPNGFSDTLGVLTLAANSTIDFGSGASSVIFAGVAAHTAGSTTLSITNWSFGSDRLIFTGNAEARSLFESSFAANDIHFVGYASGFTTAEYDTGHFEIVAVPEPSSLGLISLAAGLLAVRRRKHRRRGESM
jgi:autotransporter-associated beta strand protein